MQRCLIRHNPEIQRDEENEDGRQSPRKNYEEAGQSQAEEAHRQWHNVGADECRGPSQNPEGIDGRTGATMHQEGYREEVLYPSQQNTPALSSYFELMDRLVPNFLSALSSQKIKGTRVLLK